jgi:hypothetical protein
MEDRFIYDQHQSAVSTSANMRDHCPIRKLDLRNAAHCDYAYKKTAGESNTTTTTA